MAVYLTGDLHARFARLKVFCEEYQTTKNDVLIALGDVGLNLSGYLKDMGKKKYVRELPITLFCVHGNHEARPDPLVCDEKVRFGGVVYVECGYENIFYAKDGEIYDFFGDGTKAIVCGGAYSIDREYRIFNRLPWFPDEQPSEEIKTYVENQLEQNNWEVDYVLSHTCPRKMEPCDTFKIDQSGVDKSTEDWLDSIESRLTYKKWFCGHWHIERTVIAKEGESELHFLYYNYVKLG